MIETVFLVPLRDNDGRSFPQAAWTALSHELILHGRRVCRARKPRCGACPLAGLCPKLGVIGQLKKNRRKKRKKAGPKTERG